jgi:hypothetical protein
MALETLWHAVLLIHLGHSGRNASVSWQRTQPATPFFDAGKRPGTGVPRPLVRRPAFSQGVGRIHRTVDHDVHNVDSLRRELCVQRLAERPSTAHRGSVRMLAPVPPHCGRRRGHQDRSFAARFHERAHGGGETKQAERAKTPARLECLGRGVLQRSITDLGAEVVDGDFDRADVGLDRGDSSLDAVGLDGVEKKARCRTSVGVDRIYQGVQPVQIAAPSETRVVTLLGETSSDIATNARTGSDHQTDGFLHVRSLPQIWLRGVSAPGSALRGAPRRIECPP